MSISKALISVILAAWASVAAADPQEDAQWFLDHFVAKERWDLVKQRAGAGPFRAPLQERGIRILDWTRFAEMLPESASQEFLDAQRLHISEMVIAWYGPDHLSDIKEFFQTPVGGRMLMIGAQEDMFRDWHSGNAEGGAIARWKEQLTLMDRTKFNSFSVTPAGRFFVEETWALRNSIHYYLGFNNSSAWPALTLDKPYLVEIVETEGILEFPNRVARSALISEISNAK